MLSLNNLNLVRFFAKEYASFSEQTLQTLSARAEELDGKGIAEIDYKEGVIKVTSSDNKNFILNRQRPTQQIWYASAISGPRRFNLQNDKWIDEKNGDDLLEVFSKEIASKATMKDWKVTYNDI